VSAVTSWRSSGRGTQILGSTTPRLFTPPLVEGRLGPCGCGCALTPETSYGFDVVEFAESLAPRWVQLGSKRFRFSGRLDPWQRWAVIHAGELLADGTPRFRKVLIVVGRQNGKTTLLVVLSLWWLMVARFPMLFGTSTKIETAKEPWSLVAAVARTYPSLSRFMPSDRSGGVRTVNGGIELTTIDGARYLVGPANEDAGRSLSIDRLILDELRQHKDYSAWDAAIPTQNAIRDAQAFAISNMGDESAVVLNDLIDQGEAFIATGEGDPRFGAFLWTNEADADPEDLEALAASNPNLGYRIPPDVLLADAAAAVRAGGKKLAGFTTEILCSRVGVMLAAIDQAVWLSRCEPGTLDDVRSRVAACIDVSMDGLHATLCAAAVLPDGRVRVEPIRAWSGPGCASAMLADLPALVAEVRPRVFGWFPTGPAASVASGLAARAGWPPRGVVVEPLRDDASAACMGLEREVSGGTLVHSGDPLLDAQVRGAGKRASGPDRWVFQRRGPLHVDAVYAGAGAVHLARTLPAPVGAPRIVRAARRA